MIRLINGLDDLSIKACQNNRLILTGFNFFFQVKVKNKRIEIKLSLHCSLYIFGFTKSVLLTFICQISHLELFVAQSSNHLLSLRRRQLTSVPVPMLSVRAPKRSGQLLPANSPTW